MDDRYEPFVPDWPGSKQAQERPCVPKDKTTKCLIEEITFHEASHLIFGLLVDKENLGFLPPTSIEVNYHELTGNVRGPVSPYATNAKHKVEPWYKENPRRILSAIFQKLAGYVSYKVFIEDSEHFVGVPEIYGDGGKGNLTYCNLHGLGLTSQPKTDDFRKAVELLSWLELVDEEEKYNSVISFFTRVTYDISEILRKDCVKESIFLIKEELDKREGLILNEKLFESLYGELQAKLTDITLGEYLEKYETSI